MARGRFSAKSKKFSTFKLIVNKEYTIINTDLNGLIFTQSTIEYDFVISVHFRIG